MSGKCNLLLSIIYYLLPITLFSLEDSTTLLCSFAFGSVRTRSKGSRITRMRRIFKPSPTPPWRGFSLVTDCQLETQVASARPFIPKGGQKGGLIRERTNPSHRRYPWLILNVASEPKASEHILWGTVFQTALPYFLNTRDFVPGYSRCARYWLPAKSCWPSRIWGWIKYQ